MTPTLTIGRRTIGPGLPSYLIAEMSGNHNHDLGRALDILCAAKESGADAVKLQTYTPDTLTIDSDQDCFLIRGTLWDKRKLYDLYREAMTPWEWHPRLQAAAKELDLDLFSTPFDDTAVDFLESLGMPAHKVASFENCHYELLRKLAATRRPILLSTGMATRDELDESVRILQDGGCPQLALLKCTSAYPAPPDEMDLRTIPDLASRYGVVTGLSDHSLGITIPIAAVALGACIVEKHFTLSRRDPGPDSAFSLEPAEFKAMAEAVRTAERALGQPRYGSRGEESKSLVFRRSLFAVEDIPAGELLTSQNVRCIRPGQGLHPRHLPEVLGRRSSRRIARGTPLSWDLCEPGATAGTGNRQRSP